MDRNRVVKTGFDSGFQQAGSNLVPLLTLYDITMPNGRGVLIKRGQCDRQTGQQFRIYARLFFSQTVPFIQPLELDVKNRALETIHPIIVSDLVMIVALALSVIA